MGLPSALGPLIDRRPPRPPLLDASTVSSRHNTPIRAIVQDDQIEQAASPGIRHQVALRVLVDLLHEHNVVRRLVDVLGVDSVAQR